MSSKKEMSAQIIRETEATLSELLDGNVTLSMKVRLRKKPPIEALKAAITGVFMVDWDDITGDCRKTELTTARQIYCYLCSEYFHCSKSDIARHLNYKHHSSVITNLKRLKDLLEVSDPYMLSMLALIEQKMTINDLETDKS